MAKKTFDMATALEIKKALKAMPKKAKKETEMTAVKLVMFLSKEIKEMQSAGYELTEILAELKTRGVEVGLSTLKKALKDAETSKAKPVQQDLLDAAKTEAKETAEEAKTEAKETVKNLSDSTQEVTEEAKRKAEVLARLSQRSV